MKKLGIIFYAEPNVHMNGEGVFSYLEKFISAAITAPEYKNKQLSWSVVCPIWAQAELRKLLMANGTDSSGIEILSPPNLMFLIPFEFFTNLKSAHATSTKWPSWVYSTLKHYKNFKKKIKGKTIECFLLQENIFLFILQIFFILPVAVLFACLSRFLLLVKKTKLDRWAKKVHHKTQNALLACATYYINFFTSIVNNYYDKRFSQFANEQHDILGWYAPIPLKISLNKPLLMCFPDNVLLEFPFGFSESYYDKKFMLEMQKRIDSADFFVTYSKKTKHNPLMNYYNIDEERIFEIPTPAMELDVLINITGFKNNELAKANYCRALLKSVLASSSCGFLSQTTPEWSFIFYSSRFRPNKNILTLLKAYAFLLRTKYVTHKLVLTGTLDFPGVVDFIVNNRLENDVICLGNISQTALAACYYLADLAVNPTISEGGFPFTFSEALTTGTPVVMSKIQVVEEVITQKEDQELMLFDPYNFRDMARVIEYGINNQEKLFERQKKIYKDHYSKHTWETLVQKHMEILLKIANYKYSPDGVN